MRSNFEVIFSNPPSISLQATSFEVILREPFVKRRPLHRQPTANSYFSLRFDDVRCRLDVPLRRVTCAVVAGCGSVLISISLNILTDIPSKDKGNHIFKPIGYWQYESLPIVKGFVMPFSDTPFIVSFFKNKEVITFGVHPLKSALKRVSIG